MPSGGCGSGVLLVFGAVVPLVMFAPRFAALLWPVMLLAQLLAVRLGRPGHAPRQPTPDRDDLE